MRHLLQHCQNPIQMPALLLHLVDRHPRCSLPGSSQSLPTVLQLQSSEVSGIWNLDSRVLGGSSLRLSFSC